MIRSLICSLFVCLTLGLTAQKEHGISLVAGTEYLVRKNASLPSAFDTDPHLHFRLGVDLDRQLSTNWWFKSGLRITHFRFDTGEREALVFEQTISPIFGGQGLTEGEFSDGFRFRVTDYYIEIPLLAHWKPSNAEHFYVEAGGALNFYLSTFARLDLGDDKRTEWRRDTAGGIDELLTSVRLSAGWQWPTSNGNHLFMQPTFRYFFHSNGDLSIYSAGIEMGYRW